MFHQRKNFTEMNTYSTNPLWKGLLQQLGETKWKATKYAVTGLTEKQYNAQNISNLLPAPHAGAGARRSKRAPHPSTVEDADESDDEDGKEAVPANTTLQANEADAGDDNEVDDINGMALGTINVSHLLNVGKPYDYNEHKHIPYEVIRWDRLKHNTDMLAHAWSDGGKYESIQETVIQMIRQQKSFVETQHESLDNPNIPLEEQVANVPNVCKEIDWACDEYPAFKNLWYDLDIQFRTCWEACQAVEDGNVQHLFRILPSMYIQQIYQHRPLLARVTANFMCNMQLLLEDVDTYGDVLKFIGKHCRTLLFDGLIEHINSIVSRMLTHKHVTQTVIKRLAHLIKPRRQAIDAALGRVGIARQRRDEGELKRLRRRVTVSKKFEKTRCVIHEYILSLFRSCLTKGLTPNISEEMTAQHERINIEKAVMEDMLRKPGKTVKRTGLNSHLQATMLYYFPPEKVPNKKELVKEITTLMTFIQNVDATHDVSCFTKTNFHVSKENDIARKTKKERKWKGSGAPLVVYLNEMLLAFKAYTQTKDLASLYDIRQWFST
jgi:hypothetical protein